MDLSGKRALIFGIANERSIAWAIAQNLKKSGAQVALSYANDALKKRVEPLAKELDADFTFEMDVTNDEHYQSLLSTVKTHWESVDIIVHSVAFADREDLKRSFVETSREGFLKACDISAYSFVGLTQKLLPVIADNASLMAMTYYGSQKVIQNYNVMGVAKAALEASVRYMAYDLGARGIRVNSISAGPIKTLAASGISGFRDLLSKVEEISPMKKNITTSDVADQALFLASDYSKQITGQTIYVDSGLSILGGF